MLQLNKEDRGKIKRIQKLVIPIFLEPKELYSYDEVINGKLVKTGKIIALAANTYRGFHKTDKTKPGAGLIFPEFFIKHKSEIIRGLKKVKTEHEYDFFLDKICSGLLKQLKKNIDNTQLESYNKVRKPVDIVIEMLVCLTVEINKKDRKRLLPLLRLPLDSWMFKEKLVFPDDDLRILAVSRRFSFQSIKTRSHYQQLQGYLQRRSKELGEGLYPIALDLFWNNRLFRKGKNIAHLNGLRS